MHNFIYPAKLTPDKEDGGFVVVFRDFPEAITQSGGSANSYRLCVYTFDDR